ncbi:MAG: DNA repair protein RecN [Acidobacteriota bacterium]|nr:DNA repair protein RecN [Acidobacteriota bacterium]
MLKYLRISNFALIDRLELDFAPGLNLITGETGSGKSILVDSVSLLAGERASQEMIREGFGKARVEGVFSLKPGHPAWSLLEETGLEAEDGEIVIRREISRTGANRIFINGNLSTLGALVRLGSLMADIHGQHDQQSLLRPRTHLRHLDGFGENGELVDRVRQVYVDLEAVRRRLERLREGASRRRERMETLRFQRSELEQLSLEPGLDRRLERERDLLATAESRHQAAYESYRLLYDQESSVLALMDQAHKRLHDLSRLDPDMESAAERSLDLRYQVEEVGLELRDYAASIQWDAARLDEVGEKLSALEGIKRKYGPSLEEVLEHQAEIEEELASADSSRMREEELIREESDLESRYLSLSRKLSQKRRTDAREFCRRVEDELSQLAMGGCVFRVGIETDESVQTGQGTDAAEFLISSNPGESPRPLGRTASGGELSRITLALKSVVAFAPYPKTLVFDEVDAGIGGRVASTVGLKLARLARRDQVFCVSHWPQLACHATRHLHVDKGVRGGRTVIRVQALEGDERVRELARMTAGDSLTETTLRQARELLRRATSGSGSGSRDDPQAPASQPS